MRPDRSFGPLTVDGNVRELCIVVSPVVIVVIAVVNAVVIVEALVVAAGFTSLHFAI